MIKIRYIIYFFFTIIYGQISYANIEIKYKIGDDIITNIDIYDEKNYLLFLRPNLNNLSENEILKISTNSLIKEIIKKKELNKIYKDTDNLKFVDEIKKNLFKFKKVKNENEFINLLKKNNIEYSKIIEKLKYEGLWNEFIFQKYSSFVKIDKNTLRAQLKSNISKDKKFEYNLSELLFEINKDENLQDKSSEILKYIKLNGFKAAANRYSISSSANRGGEIGWIKETLLSNDLNKILKKLQTDMISRPLKYPNGYLLLKINEKREMQQVINIEKELDELVSFEKNRQLNQFSLLFYKKLKQNTIINEY